MLRRLLLLICGLLSSLLVYDAAALAQASDAAVCQSGRGTERLQACSRIVDSGQLNGRPISDDKLAIVLVYRSLVHSSEDRFELAISDLDRAVRLIPGYAAAHYYRGLAYEELGKLRRSLADFDAAVRADPKFTRALSKRAEANLASGEIEEAVADFNEVLRRKPKDAIALAGRGAANLALARYGDASDDLRKAIQIDPDYAPAHRYRGEARLALGDHIRAIIDFDRAIELDPDDFGALCGRGRVLVLRGEFDRAIADFDKSLRARQVGNFCLLDRGRAYLRNGQPDLALEDFEEAARLEKSGPRFIEATALLIAAFDAVGQVPRANAMIERAASDDPDIAAKALQFRAESRARQGSLDPALSDLRRAAELEPENASVRLGIGTVLYRAGRRRLARREWREACDLATATTIRQWQYALSHDEHYTGDIEDSCSPDFFKAMAACVRARCEIRP